METFETNGTRYRVREKELTQKQTDDNPRVAMMRREFAEHPSSGLTPARLNQILTNAEQGDLIQQSYLAEDLEEKDTQIQAELFKRKMAITAVPHEVEPPVNASTQEKKDAIELNQILRDTDNWHDVLFGMADGILKGFSNTEFNWDNYRGFRIPQHFEHRPATWFQLHQDDQNVIALRDQTGKGEILRPLNWLHHRHAAKSGYPARIGLVRQLSWPFVFKSYSLRDLAEFLEIYGIPIRLGKYPSGATDSEKQRLLQAVINIGHNAGGIMPKGMEMEFHDAAKGGGGDPFMTMMMFCERAQSKCILGQTLTSQSDSTGSQALGNVHNEVRQDIRDHDVRQIANTLNRDLIWPMYMLNGKSYTGDPRRKPKLVFDVQEPEDLKLYSEALPALVGIGVQVPASYAHEKLRIPMPQNGEAVLSAQQTSAVRPEPVEGKTSTVHPEREARAVEGLTEAVKKGKISDSAAALKLAIAALKSRSPVTSVRPEPVEGSEEPDAADTLTDNLQKQSTETFARLMQPIEDLVANAESLEQLLEQLLELEDKLDTNDYQELLAQAFAAAELAGRFDVSQGN
ncbi:DUF935 domain-containing protein [Neptunicella sp. SCSIO 80796]|uniref:DUF935 domain-containing protein n=1 Tax=Neptunicella plasticusilytica TaxID=3117012 RepID=UPI003A4E18F7